MKPRRILWPTDLSEADFEALEVACELAGPSPTELLLVHVVEDPARELYGDDASEGRDRSAWAFWKVARQEAEDRFRLHLQDRVRLPASRVRHLALLGDPADRIIEVARTEGVALVVLAGRPRQSRVFGEQLGSVAYRLVRELPCDVLVIKQGSADRSPDRGAPS